MAVGLLQKKRSLPTNQDSALRTATTTLGNLFQSARSEIIGIIPLISIFITNLSKSSHNPFSLSDRKTCSSRYIHERRSFETAAPPALRPDESRFGFQSCSSLTHTFESVNIIFVDFHSNFRIPALP